MKNVYSRTVSVTVTISGLPSGVSFTPASVATIAPSQVYRLGTLNLTITVSATVGGPVPGSVTFAAVHT